MQQGYRAARSLRAAVITHAKAQPPAHQTQAGTATWQPADWDLHGAAAQYDPHSRSLTVPGTYMPSALMPSLSACVGRDIVVLTRDPTTRLITRCPTVYLAIPLPPTRTRSPVLVSTAKEWSTLTARVTDTGPPLRPPTTRLPTPRVLLFDGTYDTTTGRCSGHYTALLPASPPTATGSRADGLRPSSQALPPDHPHAPSPFTSPAVQHQRPRVPSLTAQFTAMSLIQQTRASPSVPGDPG